MKTKITTIALAAALGLAGAAHGQLLYQADFNAPAFSDGDLVGQDGWANHSGSGEFIQVSNVATDGFITLNQGGGSREDANIDLGATMGAGSIWSASFDVTVLSGSSSVYIAHFKDGGFGFNARVFLADPVDGGDFTFGISDTSSSPDTTFSSDFSFNTTYRPTVTYNFDTGISSLTVGTESVSSINADIGQSMTSFAFRQAGGSFVSNIDNLEVSAVPEPSAYALLAGLLGLGYVMVRRRRA